MWKEKIALQLYSVREDLKQDFFGTLRKVREMGYTAVEFAGLCGNDPVEVKKICEQLGLVPLSAHVPFLELRDNLEETMDCYVALGVRYIVVPYLTQEYRPGNDAFYGVLDALPVFAAAAKKKGLILQYHNHDFEFVKLDGEYALDRMYRTIGADLLQTQLDTCWVNFAGEDPVEYLKKYAGRIPTVHLKDFVGVKSESCPKPEFRALGTGRQDFPAIINTALECGADWFIVEQDQPNLGHTTLECAAISAQYLLNLA